MKNIPQKLKDRFKPGIFDRLKQSQDARQQMHDRKTQPKKIPDKPKKKEKQKKISVDVETTPHRVLESATSYHDTDGRAYRREIWREWNTPLTAATCYHNSNTVWDIWHGGTGSSITCNGIGTSQDVWRGWTGANSVIIHSTSNIITSSIGETWEHWQTQEQPRRQQRPIETPEMLRVRERQEEQYRQQRAAENARYEEERRASENRRKEAEDRAMQLLVSMLNPQQQSDLRNHKYFFVEAPSGRLYRIDYGMHGNVKVVDRVTRKIVERLCIQPSGVMAGDANLMQKLLIETSEDAFRAHANITLENGSVVSGQYGGLSDERLDNVIPIRRAA